jgi:hypothetical protein
MKSSDPPLVATWLLSHLTHDNQCLSGDLLEQFRSGRTRVWYWRQVLLAILVGAWCDVRHHPWLMARGLTLGVLSQYVVAIGSGAVGHLLFMYGFNPTFSVILLWTCSGHMLIGWAVARLHRPYGLTIVLLLVSCSVALQLPHVAFLLSNTFEHARYVPYLTQSLVATAVTTLCLLAGGLLGTASSEREPAVSS